MQSAQPDDGLAPRVFLAVIRLARVLQAQQPAGLSASEISVMARLEDGPASPAGLAAAERISAPSVTRHVAALRARELVSTAGHPGDRRQVVLELTDRGREVLAAARAASWLAGRIAALDAGQRDKLRKALPALGELHIACDAKSPR